MKLLTRILYVVVILAGLTAIGVILLQSKSTCIKSENVCLRYPSSWKQADLGSAKAIRLINSKPGAVMQLTVSNNKITGTVEAVAAAIDTQLQKNVSSYKFLKSEQLIVNNIRSVEVTYQLAQSSTDSRVITQKLVVVPLGDKTYVFTVEAAPSDIDKISNDVDYVLSHVEIKR